MCIRAHANCPTVAVKDTPYRAFMASFATAGSRPPSSQGKPGALRSSFHTIHIILHLLPISFESVIMARDACRIGQEGRAMIGAAQLRGARALLGIDRRQLALLSGLSVQTIQRSEEHTYELKSLMRLSYADFC